MTEPRRARLLTMLRSRPAAVDVPLPEQFCQVCTEALGIDGAGLSLITDQSHRETIGASNDVAARIEELQITLGEGPCIDAFTHGEPVLAPDLNERAILTRWPGFAPGAVAAGAGAVFGFPLSLGAVRVGALDLYRDRPGDLNYDQVTDALLLADLATVGILNTQATTRISDEALHWQDEDLGGHHTVVHQATGMVMVQLNVTIEEASIRLRAYAFANDRRLTEVAADVVAHRLRID